MSDVRHGDCLTILPTLDACSIDSVVTDPPYGLKFMGKRWDHGVPGEHFWTEVLRVAKPGAYLLAFGGTRTFHRLMVAIEDAGWEIRDTLMWVYGSGFPKSHNGAWGGTALKPAWEPIIMARKPLIGTVAANVEQHGTGGLGIDECRVNTGASPSAAYRANGKAPSSCKPGEYGDGHAIQNRISPERWLEERPGELLGRWPANLIHDGSKEALDCFPEAPGQIADSSSSSSSRKTQHVYGAMKRGNGRDGEASADDANEGVVGFNMKPGARRGDAGSAARFFYCAKTDSADRNDGGQNNHPTVKPTALMQWCVRLVTPAGGVVLDPFMGSGSTGRAAMLEKRRFIGIDLDEHYCDIARARIAASLRSTLPEWMQ